MMLRRRRIHTSGSEERLERLIEERLQPLADHERIDQRIWDLFGETWAIMFTDLSGFSRQVEQFGIIHFLQTIYESERVLVPVIERHDGVLLKSEGDSFLIIFRHASSALQCAIAMQQMLRLYNARKPEEEDILLCIGLGYGKVLKIGDADVFGAQVNAASKLGEDTAKAWEILVTGEVKAAVEDRNLTSATALQAGVSFAPIDTVPPGAETAFTVKYPAR